MDPYLEDDPLWPLFHQELLTSLDESLRPGIAGRYHCKVAHRHYRTEQASDVSGRPADRQEPYLQIIAPGDGKLITHIDLVSPGNKTTAPGREAYLATRSEAKAQKANLIEIDLVLQGRPMLDYSRDGLPNWDYAVTVTRMVQPDRFEIYTSTLEKKLPRFRLPLACNDRDLVVDLQAVFASTYDRGEFGSRIDYRRDPGVPLSPETRQWLGTLLQEKNLRPPGNTGATHGADSAESLSHERIATAAYYLWQQAGCPPGRAEEYWYKAVEQLKEQTGMQPEKE